MLQATDVFKPNGIPDTTYVDRSEHRLEQLLRDAFAIENFVVSVSGPSKTGKTVLISKTVDPDNLILVSGASIQEPLDVWRYVLSWMEVPTDLKRTSTKGSSIGAGVSAEGKMKVPLIMEGGASGNFSGKRDRSEAEQAVIQSDYFSQVSREIGGSGFVIFIDDFHYIPKIVQSEVAKQVKSIAERGVRVCTASVPHRSDDVVRSNPELRGRLASVDCGYWQPSDLIKIAQQGFEALNFNVSRNNIERLAREAFGSPQLMQTLCLNFCFEIDARERKKDRRDLTVENKTLENVLVRSSMFADYSTLVEKLHGGPKERGTERKPFVFSGGSTGDVYRAVLLGLSQEPATQTFSYDDILARVKLISTDAPPVGSSISASLQQMQKIAEKIAPESEILEWDEDTLNIIEPYFLFYLRCSDKLQSLGDPG